MATIKVTTNEFPDIIVMFLMDYIMNNKITIKNDNWDYFVDKMIGKGLKAQVLKYYIDIDAIEKSKYKEIKGIFTDKGSRSTINIVKNDTKPNKDDTKVSTIKKIVKKVLHITEKRKKRYYNMPLTDEVINGIVNKVINENVENGNIDDLLNEGDI